MVDKCRGLLRGDKISLEGEGDVIFLERLKGSSNSGDFVQCKVVLDCGKGKMAIRRLPKTLVRLGVYE